MADPIRTGVLLLSLAVGGASWASDDMPARRAGLWETSIESDGKPLHSTRQCVDARTDRQMQAMGTGLASGSCTKKDMRRESGRIVADTVCRIGDSTVTSHAVITGDFNAQLRTESTARYDPPLMGRATSKVVVTSKWTGECPADWKPGDMEMPGGRQRINIADMLKATGK